MKRSTQRNVKGEWTILQMKKEKGDEQDVIIQRLFYV